MDDKLQHARDDQQWILVVDDDTFILETLREGLSLKEYLCETAVDASRSLELIGKRPFHSVIIDINLADMNGLELVQKIKTRNPTMVIIVMTGFINEFSHEDAMKAGASDFIKKPFSVEELIVRIQHAKAHEALYRKSLHDDLTGLYNRRGFFTLAEYVLKGAIRKQEGLFMLYADLDDLKSINDTLGHQNGDHALIDTANILRDNFRDSHIIARIGGDEFVVMPIEKDVDFVINRLHRAVEMDNLKRLHLREYKLSITAGVAYFNPWTSCTVDELLSKANRSMDRQKKNKYPLRFNLLV
jgi:diguanylate cyclase (GGDEF)-like protein